MKDLIYRQDAIDALGEEPEVWYSNDDIGNGMRTQWGCDREAIEALPSAQLWIPCSERLPKQIGDYLITIRQSYNDSICYDTDVATFEGSWVTFNDWDEGFGFDIVAWCDLPKPYKEDEQCP